MPTSEEKLAEVERLLVRVNLELQKLLLDPTFTAADPRKKVAEIERLSRWKRYTTPESQDPFAFAAMRAEVKAKENGEPFVVAETEDRKNLVCIPKSRFEKEAPFGLNGTHVVYDTSTTGPINAPK